MSGREIFSAIALVASFSTSSFAAEVGVQQIAIPAASQGRDLMVNLWYPADPGGEMVQVGENGVFKGSPAFLGGPPAPGHYPLVVLSHGSGSRVQGMSWLAVELAKAGFIVAGPNHPGTTSGDSTPAETPKLWQRTNDLSAVIDRLTTDPQWRERIEVQKIGVMGFSLGGAAALLSAGAHASLEAYARYCDTYTQWDCAWYAGGIGYVNDAPVKVDKVDLRSIDKVLFEQSHLDRRIKSAVLLDPGLAQAYDEASIEAVSIPLSFINLGTKGSIPLGVRADGLAALAPDASYATVADAVHYSGLPECKDGAAERLKAFGEEEPICEDGGSRSRGDIHAELIRLIRDAFDRTLKNRH